MSLSFRRGVPVVRVGIARNPEEPPTQRRPYEGSLQTHDVRCDVDTSFVDRGGISGITACCPYRRSFIYLVQLSLQAGRGEAQKAPRRRKGGGEYHPAQNSR